MASWQVNGKFFWDIYVHVFLCCIVLLLVLLLPVFDLELLFSVAEIVNWDNGSVGMHLKEREIRWATWAGYQLLIVYWSFN